MKPAAIAAAQGFVAAVFYTALFWVFETLFSEEAERIPWSGKLLQGAVFGLFLFFYYWYQARKKVKKGK